MVAFVAAFALVGAISAVVNGVPAVIAVAGIGFTVALFFATAAFKPGPELDQTKMGALFSFIAAPLAIAIGRAVGLSPRGAR